MAPVSVFVIHYFVFNDCVATVKFFTRHNVPWCEYCCWVVLWLTEASLVHVHV